MDVCTVELNFYFIYKKKNCQSDNKACNRLCIHKLLHILYLWRQCVRITCPPTSDLKLDRKKMKRSPSRSSSSSSSTSPSREKKAKKKKKRQEVKKLKREKKKEKKEKKRQKKLALKAERAAASVSNAVSDETPQTYLTTWQSEEAKEHGPGMCTPAYYTLEIHK